MLRSEEQGLKTRLLSKSEESIVVLKLGILKKRIES